MMRRRVEAGDVGPMLARALAAGAAGFGCTAIVIEHRSVAWSSATFVGERHAMSLALTGRADAWLAGLAEADFTLRGHLVADLRVVEARGDMAVIDVLTLIDC